MLPNVGFETLTRRPFSMYDYAKAAVASMVILPSAVAFIEACQNTPLEQQAGILEFGIVSLTGMLYGPMLRFGDQLLNRLRTYTKHKKRDYDQTHDSHLRSMLSSGKIEDLVIPGVKKTEQNALIFDYAIAQARRDNYSEVLAASSRLDDSKVSVLFDLLESLGGRLDASLEERAREMDLVQRVYWTRRIRKAEGNK